MSNKWGGKGYDNVPEQEAGVFLRLKKKGQEARVRLVSEPFLFVDEFKDRDGNSKSLNKAAWVAISKEIVDGKPVKRVVVFEAGPMVLYSVRDLAKSDEWGDPTMYDIKVTRTEEAGKYYVVVPLPKPMGPISDEDEALVKAANLNLEELCTKKGDGSGGSRSAADPRDEYDPFDPRDEYDPFADE